ncbi:Gfo/Idh/MocA family protein [Dethiobacter alkaliphilus]|uniref:Gfo/Idh/MocA family protein n=1 Tax=Dethiobacter alkaliphilus TaxID=427926 RepID=UPI002226563A|nr:Gfo/Idh/MocA family oxidoreductase [Dethiobacter alkaliphilus]MCW3489272.1 Gfo/Idh/MocA family oxidoreductase [Dethiobacter alkaliphilus]
MLVKMIKEHVNIALIGAGYWGQNYLRVFNQLPGARLKWCCDTNQRRLAELAAAYPTVRFCTEVQKVLQDPDVDAVVIASPPTSHYCLGREALAAGKHLLLEKPFAFSVNEVNKLWADAENSGLTLMAAHIMEYNPAVQKIKQYLQEKKFGELYYLYFSRSNLGVVRSDVNVVWDLAVHDLSVIRYLLEANPVQVSATGVGYLQPGISDVVFITLIFPGNILGQIHASWLEACKTRQGVLVGDRQTIIFDDLQPRDKIRIYNRCISPQHAPGPGNESAYRFVPTYGDIILPAVADAEPLRAQCLHFLECITDKKLPLTGKKDTLWVTKVAELAQQSLDAGGEPLKFE